MITDVPFWRSGTGNRERIGRLVDFLVRKHRLTVVYVGLEKETDAVKLQGSEFRMEFLCQTAQLTPAEYGGKVRELAKGAGFDVCIVEYVHNSYFLNYLPGSMVKFLDMHDLVSERSKGFKVFNRRDPFEGLSSQEEIELFSLYDRLICICEPDLYWMEQYFDKSRLILAAHAPSFFKQACRERVKSIGYLASAYAPNVDGINKFVQECWPSIAGRFDVDLEIYGNVVKYIDLPGGVMTVRLRGYVEDLEDYYGAVDMVINPVEYGAGIKIKNIEALAHSMPLVTSAHGAKGMEDGIDKAFLMANDSRDFVEKITLLISDFEWRRGLSEAAYSYALGKFSPERCYGPLVAAIDALDWWESL